MQSATLEQVAIDVAAPDGAVVLRATGSVIKFDGFLRLYQESRDDADDENGDRMLQAVSENDRMETGEIKPEQHFTKPPARFSEASLVKTLEKQGIGRPSTYASIIATIQDRGYVYQEERKFHASELGCLVTDILRPHFPEILDVAFTASMETKLDGIEDGKADWVSVLRDFFEPFSSDMEKAQQEIHNYRKQPIEAERKCPECKKGMVYRWRGASKYLACVDYPECKTTIALDRDGKEKVRELTEHKCPKCGTQMILRSGRFGKFLACSAYPDCKSTLSVDKDGNPVYPEVWKDPCPECGKEMIVRRGRRGRFIACTGYPECKKTLPYKKAEEEAKEAEPAAS